MRYVASLIEIGDSVEVLGDLYRDWGVRQGHRGRVVSDVRNVGGYDWVTVKFDGVADDMDVMCGDIEILN